VSNARLTDVQTGLRVNEREEFQDGAASGNDAGDVVREWMVLAVIEVFSSSNEVIFEDSDRAALFSCVEDSSAFDWDDSRRIVVEEIKEISSCLVNVGKVFVTTASTTAATTEITSTAIKVTSLTSLRRASFAAAATAAVALTALASFTSAATAATISCFDPSKVSINVLFIYIVKDGGTTPDQLPGGRIVKVG